MASFVLNWTYQLELAEHHGYMNCDVLNWTEQLESVKFNFHP